MMKEFFIGQLDKFNVQKGDERAGSKDENNKKELSNRDGPSLNSDPQNVPRAGPTEIRPEGFQE